MSNIKFLISKIDFLGLLLLGGFMSITAMTVFDSVERQTMPDKAINHPVSTVYTVITSEHWQLIINGSERPLELRVDNTLDSIGCDASTNKDNIGKYCILADKDDIISFMDSMGVHITQ